MLVPKMIGCETSGSFVALWGERINYRIGHVKVVPYLSIAASAGLVKYLVTLIVKQSRHYIRHSDSIFESGSNTLHCDVYFFAKLNNDVGDWGNVCARQTLSANFQKNMATVFPKLNLFDLLLFSVLPTETMNNLRFAWHQPNGTSQHWVAGHGPPDAIGKRDKNSAITCQQQSLFATTIIASFYNNRAELSTNPPKD